jgi:hypothetical protein
MKNKKNATPITIRTMHVQSRLKLSWKTRLGLWIEKIGLRLQGLKPGWWQQYCEEKKPFQE